MTMSSAELDLSDGAFPESDYDGGGSDSGSHLLKPFVPLSVSPQKFRRQQTRPVRQRSTFSDRDRSSFSHYYGSGNSGDLTTTTSSEGGPNHSKYYHPYGGSGPRHERNQFDTLIEENRKLKQQNLVLQTEVSTIRDLYHTLTQSLPGVFMTTVKTKPTNLSSRSASPMLNSMSTFKVLQEEPLSPSDYPRVRFWFRKDWINRTKDTLGITKVNGSSTSGQEKGRGPIGINVSLRYVEDEQGAVIDGFRASEMRKFAQSIWSQLVGVGKAPKSWGKAELDVAAHYRREMRHRFPELGLCEFDWKADQLATDNYPNWASNNLQGVPVKGESSDTLLTQTKRRRDSAGHISKKARTESVLPLSIDVAPTPPSDAVGHVPAFLPINSTTLTTPTPSSSATVPATIPTITIPAAIPTVVPATVPTIAVSAAVPTITTSATIPTITISIDDNNTASVAQGLEEETVLPDPTPALTTTTQESPTSIIANAPPLFNPIIMDGSGAATKTLDFSDVTSPQDDASISRKSLPCVATPALTMMSQESPVSIIANAPSLFNPIIRMDGNGAATKTLSSSDVTLPLDGASISRKTMPRVINPLSLEPLSTTVQIDDERHQQSTLINPLAFPIDPALELDVGDAVVGAGAGHSQEIIGPTLIAADNINQTPFIFPPPTDFDSIVAPGTSVDISQTPDTTVKRGPSKKAGKMRPGSSNTARNLCAQEWVQSNPLGTTVEFKTYYDNLSIEEKKKYQDLQKRLKSQP